MKEHAGNTGIGLCLIGNSIGYKTIIVMNEDQTQEKRYAKKYGADLRLVPPKLIKMMVICQSIIN